MLARIIFCVVVAAAVLAVVLLATVSPLPHRAAAGGHKGTRTFTVYVHPTLPAAAAQARQQGEDEAVVRQGEASALVFHHRMTVGPESTSRTVGAASGFLLPAGQRGVAATSVFDTVHLAFDAGGGLSGSLCVEASEKRRTGKRGRGEEDKEEVLRVVGGTGAFAFARGHAVLRGQRTGRPGATALALRLEISVSAAGS